MTRSVCARPRPPKARLARHPSRRPAWSHCGRAGSPPRGACKRRSAPEPRRGARRLPGQRLSRAARTGPRRPGRALSGNPGLRPQLGGPPHRQSVKLGSEHNAPRAGSIPHGEAELAAMAKCHSSSACVRTDTPSAQSSGSVSANLTNAWHERFPAHRHTGSAPRAARASEPRASSGPRRASHFGQTCPDRSRTCASLSNSFPRSPASILAMSAAETQRARRPKARCRRRPRLSLGWHGPPRRQPRRLGEPGRPPPSQTERKRPCVL